MVADGFHHFLFGTGINLRDVNCILKDNPGTFVFEISRGPCHDEGSCMSRMRNKLLAALGAAFAMILTPTHVALAQRAPLPLGLIDSHSITRLRECPTGYYPGMTCYSGKVQACPFTDDLGFTYGYLNPPGDIAGTIVFLEGGGGTTPYLNPNYVQTYLPQGYQVVYLAWDTDWEYTSGSTGNSIKYAACRPATFLQYISQNLYSSGGMCVQGDSAGAGAVAYALAWYGAGSFLDGAELLSGPVFGDIEQGCVVPGAPTVEVCSTGQHGCVGAEWPDSPAYVDGNESEVADWSGIAGCSGSQKTSPSANNSWKAMSIVDGTDDPTFNYPTTAMAGWLCSNENSVQNNSAAEAEFFYQQFTGANQTSAYSVTRINFCGGVEGVSAGQLPDGESGLEAISNNMLGACFKRHNRNPVGENR